MKNNGYEVSNINILTLNDLNNIAVKDTTSLPYEEWYNNAISGNNNPSYNHYEFGLLRDYLSDEHKWLYSSTYWLRTGYGGDVYLGSGVIPFPNDLVFIDSVGGVCGAGVNTSSPSCDFLAQTEIGCGVRPVISISSSDIEYLIKKKSDCNSEIEIPESSLGGQEVPFRVTLKKRMPFEIKTDSGEIIQFTEENMTNNSDGTVTISGKFTMPFESLTFETKCVEVVSVPDTLRNSGIIGLLLLIGVSLFAILKFGNYFNIKKKA